MSKANASALGIKDLSWASTALMYIILVNILSPNIHIKLAAVRGLMYRKMFGIPDHVIDNVTAAFEQLDSRHIHDISRRHVEFSQETRLERILPLLLGFRKSKGWRIEGETNLRSVLQQGKGALLLTAHFGYARLIEPVLRLQGYDALRVVAKVPGGGLNRAHRWEQWIQKRGRFVRHCANVFLLDLLRSNNVAAGLDIRPILRALSQKQLVVVAGDGLVSTTFLKLNFLGKQYPFATGYVKIALMTGVPVVPVFATRDAGEIVIELLPPIEIHEGSTVEDCIRRCAHTLESRIRLMPHLWTRWSNTNVWKKALAWSERDPEERFLRHNPWSYLNEL
jgi:lauroyl/myristoyl acyltransferase